MGLECGRVGDRDRVQAGRGKFLVDGVQMHKMLWGPAGGGFLEEVTF